MAWASTYWDNWLIACQASRGIIDEVDVVQFKLTMNLTPAESAPGDR